MLIVSMALCGLNVRMPHVWHNIICVYEWVCMYEIKSNLSSKLMGLLSSVVELFTRMHTQSQLLQNSLHARRIGIFSGSSHYSCSIVENDHEKLEVDLIES